MDAELVALTSSAATTVVGLLATDAWEQTKLAVARLGGSAVPSRRRRSRRNWSRRAPNSWCSAGGG